MTNTSQALTTKTNLRKKYSALIFDCDGTLSDSMPLHFVAWSTAMIEVGLSFPEERFYAMGGMPSGQIIEILSREQSVVVDPVAVSLRKESLFAETIDRILPLEAVCKIAQDHFGRLPMAVASGGIAPVIQRQLSQLGISDLFSVVVTAEDTERHKPYPDVFLAAAERLGVAPEDCLVFEDAQLGFDAAVAAGMDYIDVRNIDQWSNFDFANGTAATHKLVDLKRNGKEAEST